MEYKELREKVAEMVRADSHKFQAIMTAIDTFIECKAVEIEEKAKGKIEPMAIWGLNTAAKILRTK